MSATRLLLKQLAETREALPVKWDLDCPARGVVILDITVGGSVSSAPLHWRAGDWTKPPLDIRLSGEGAIESIQFVFQDEVIEENDVIPPTNVETGVPRFDVDAWPSNRYSDARVSVKTMRLPSGELYAKIGDANPSRSVSATWGLRFDFDTDQLAGIVLGPLTSDEWQVIEASAPLADG